MINFYSRILPGIARMLQPLTAALAGSKALPWTLTLEAAFNAAKYALVTAVPLALQSQVPPSPWRQMPPTPTSAVSYNRR